MGVVKGGSALIEEVSNLDSVSKLAAYTHLFNDQAISEFE